MEIKLTSGKTLSVSEGESLYHALKRQGIYLVSSCGGKGTCGKCRVRVVEGRYEAVSFGNLTQKDKDAGTVMACQTFPLENILVEIPRQSRLIVISLSFWNPSTSGYCQ